MNEDTRDFIRSQQEIGSKLESAEALVGFDLSQLRSWDDLDLAAWQIQYGVGSMQHILASQEWQRRIVARQIRASHITAWVGVIGTLFGVFFGWWLSSLQHRSDTKGRAQSQAVSQSAIHQSVGTPAPTPTPAGAASAQKLPNPNP
jgi:hypothetical protein